MRPSGVFRGRRGPLPGSPQTPGRGRCGAPSSTSRAGEPPDAGARMLHIRLPSTRSRTAESCEKDDAAESETALPCAQTPLCDRGSTATDCDDREEIAESQRKVRSALRGSRSPMCSSTGRFGISRREGASRDAAGAPSPSGTGPTPAGYGRRPRPGAFAAACGTTCRGVGSTTGFGGEDVMSASSAARQPGGWTDTCLLYTSPSPRD